MATVLDELLVGLGFEYDPEEVQQFNEDLENTVKSIKKLVTAAVAGAAAITAFTVASTQATHEQGLLAGEVGETVGNIDALQFALVRAGGTSDGMTNSLRQLSIRAAEAARGVGSGVEAFGILGISSLKANGQLKSSSDLLLEISKQFNGLDAAKQIELADKLGIRDSIRLLQQGPDAIRALTTEAIALGVTTEEDALIAAQFQNSLTDLWQIVKQISRTISKVFAPGMQELNNQFTEWWKTNRALIELNLPKWVATLTSALKLLTIAVAGFLAFKLLSTIVTLITLFRGLTTAIVLTNVAAFLLPILIGALAAAFVTLIQDARVFFQGGQSFIGDMLKKYPEWAKELNVIAAVFGTIADLTAMIFEGWSNIFDLNFGDFLKDLPRFVGGLIGQGGQGFEDFIKDLPNSISGLIGVGGETPALVPQLGNNTNNRSSTVVDKVEIVIQGGLDSSTDIADAVLNVFQQTTQDLNSAVDQ